ncbi:alpha-glucosidase/alpha-galactosidase [Mahella australiensis]|uniref:Alpha-galactosidase n=1 Tax=Mahella australiensis (strain DSM 15567 / CIP 107919 / 50-1 BON) TaxID=697281 RepID=F3ZZ65_MAHA5|nr:alpha-glucosidase/alpha-galactosidase [Mahella australiensis]AEE97847.1 alpha-galactosidase [Mahella australiensis 50-1 BON]
MSKITFLGAGSTVFAKNVLGDCMLVPSLQDSEFALFDIDEERLSDSYKILCNLKERYNSGVSIKAYADRKEALKDANYVINAIYVGAKEKIYMNDFVIPNRYGLRQTIGDTSGIGGLFRGLRTIKVMQEFARDIEEVCPDACLLNYTNPMSIVTGYVQRATSVKTVGLCHSVQACVPGLLKTLGMEDELEGIKWKIAGINHMAWLLEVADKHGEDLYPEIRHRADIKQQMGKHNDMVRFEIMRRFGYYVTESSIHNAEYNPYFIKNRYPELIEKFNISLDQHPKNYADRLAKWAQMRDELTSNKNVEHEPSNEYASQIINAMETNEVCEIAGNVSNNGGLIENLPNKACVEVPCLVDGSGVNPCYVGELPEQLAALNRNSINMHLMTIEAVMSKDKEKVYQAAMLDPHTGAELSMDDIISLCDEMMEANQGWLPEFKLFS